MTELLVPAGMLAGFAVLWWLFRPDPTRRREIERALLQGARVVDVRPEDAFRERHILGAESVPLERLPEALQPTERVIVYGASEADSAQAAQVLRAQGFAWVVDAGPMSHWPVPQAG